MAWIVCTNQPSKEQHNTEMSDTLQHPTPNTNQAHATPTTYAINGGRVVHGDHWLQVAGHPAHGAVAQGDVILPVLAHAHNARAGCVAAGLGFTGGQGHRNGDGVLVHDQLGAQQLRLQFAGAHLARHTRGDGHVPRLVGTLGHLPEAGLEQLRLGGVAHGRRIAGAIDRHTEPCELAGGGEPGHMVITVRTSHIHALTQKWHTTHHSSNGFDSDGPSLSWAYKTPRSESQAPLFWTCHPRDDAVEALVGNTS